MAEAIQMRKVSGMIDDGASHCEMPQHLEATALLGCDQIGRRVKTPRAHQHAGCALRRVQRELRVSGSRDGAVQRGVEVFSTDRSSCAHYTPGGLRSLRKKSLNVFTLARQRADFDEDFSADFSAANLVGSAPLVDRG